MRIVLIAVLALPLAVASAQNPSAAPNPFDQHTAQELTQRAAEVLAGAEKSASGSYGITLEKYPGHYTMITARVKSGGPELHKHFNDIFVVLDGEATELVGGTLVDPQEISPGEFHASSIAGGERHLMRKGDIIHIAPDTPHQTLLAPGATFIYYVIKVEVPKETK